MSRSGMNAFLALWRAYGEGRLERSLDLIDAACEVVALDGETTYRGHDGVRQWFADSRMWRSVTVTSERLHEPHPGCIVWEGRFARGSAHGAPDDSAFTCVAEFRDGRLVHARTFTDHAAALRFAAGRHDASAGGAQPAP